MEILLPKLQTSLYGYENYFNTFINLYKKKKLPNVILLRGPKGSGKATFIYHFINCLLSSKDDYNYSNFKINQNSSSFNLIKNNLHPNFFLLDNDDNKDIKIEKTRNLLKFLSKSTYSKELKLILIDNSDFLNLSSSNSLLKLLEEPFNNTFFFFI